MEDRVHLAVWWLPEAPEHKVTGTFTFKRSEGPRLALIGTLVAPQEVVEHLSTERRYPNMTEVPNGHCQNHATGVRLPDGFVVSLPQVVD